MNDNSPNTMQTEIAQAIVAAMEEFNGEVAFALAKVRRQFPRATLSELDAARREAGAILRALANAAAIEADQLEREGRQ